MPDRSRALAAPIGGAVADQAAALPLFARNLREAIRDVYYTQEKFARAMDVSNRAVSTWCMGLRRPRPRKMAQVCYLLDHRREWFEIEHGYGN